MIKSDFKQIALTEVCNAILVVIHSTSTILNGQQEGLSRGPSEIFRRMIWQKKIKQILKVFNHVHVQTKGVY